MHTVVFSPFYKATPSAMKKLSYNRDGLSWDDNIVVF